MAGTKGKLRRSRKLPGKPIEWRKFLAMNLGDRDLRLTVFQRNRAVLVHRGPVKSILYLDGYFPAVSVNWRWTAVMILDGRDAGQRWERDTKTAYSFSVGNRPRLLPGGRIVLYREKTLVIDLLPEGDTLDPMEIRR